MRVALLLGLLVACGGNPPPSTSPTPISPPPPGSDAGAPSTTTCNGPAPGPDYVCVENCGPPVVRQGDPPPGWSWLSPADVEARNRGGCPRCLAADTRIATPSGERAISELSVGDAILSVDGAGNRVAATVAYIGSTLASGTHRLVRITLADGRVVAASAGHPDAARRALGTLQLGDRLDGSRIDRIDVVPLAGDRTWDILPSGTTGLYIANGVTLRSTFAE